MHRVEMNWVGLPWTAGMVGTASKKLVHMASSFPWAMRVRLSGGPLWPPEAKAARWRAFVCCLYARAGESVARVDAEVWRDARFALVFVRGPGRTGFDVARGGAAAACWLR
ncbi:hypothetical protein ASD86_14615 [Lysobacter sp. Root690]|nr:hypothetical protein ASD86_14615 [Lysobacter sp. Root690]